jgi:signal peptidase II
MKTKYFVAALLVFVLDHATKWIVCAKLNPARPIDLIPGYLSFVYAENTGVAFGFFNSVESPWKPYLLASLAVAAVVLILIYGARMPADRVLLHWALAITMGGILGNLADRVFRGRVIDFIDFHIHEFFHWPAFNVADSSITIGIALLLLDTVKNPAGEEADAQPTADERK